MRTDVDVVVVGAGLMGAASAWTLVRRGRSVLLVEQFEAGHRRGSSHGSARIVRRAYRDPFYVRLTGRAFELWRELESVSGAPVLRLLGGLDVGDPGEVAAVAEQLSAAGVAYDLLPGTEAEKRWPGMRFPGPAVFHPQAGVLDAAAAVEVFTAQAAAEGAAVRYGTAVTAIRVAGGQAVLRLADGSEVRSRHAVVAAGAWVGPLLCGQVELPPLTVTQQDVFHFRRLDPDAAPWPSVIHLGPHPTYHLAGGRDGGPGEDRKLGEHDPGSVTTADSADSAESAIGDAARRRASEYVRRWLPGLDPAPRRETTCLYTRTPSEDFVLDRVGPLVVCSPCSGHGAKFAPLIGELIGDLVDGRAAPDRFRLASHRVASAGTASL
jgi:monomeric sarcosine oxidase